MGDSNVVVISSDEEDEKTLWKSKATDEHFQRLFKKVKRIIFNRSRRYYISDGFPYGRFVEYTQELETALATVSSKNTRRFIWRCAVRWLVPLKNCIRQPIPLSEDWKYNYIVTNIMAQYINFKCEYYHDRDAATVQEQIEEILRMLEVAFSCKTEFVLITFLKIRIRYEYRDILIPLFKAHLLSPFNYDANEFSNYVCLVLCYRQWKRLMRTKESRETINEYACGQIERLMGTYRPIDLTLNPVLPWEVPKATPRNEIFLKLHHHLVTAKTTKNGTRLLLASVWRDWHLVLKNYFKLYEQYNGFSIQLEPENPGLKLPDVGNNTDDDVILISNEDDVIVIPDDDDLPSNSGSISKINHPSFIEKLKRLAESTPPKSLEDQERTARALKCRYCAGKPGTVMAVNQHLTKDCDISSLSKSLLSSSIKNKTQISCNCRSLGYSFNENNNCIVIETTDDDDSDNDDNYFVRDEVVDDFNDKLAIDLGHNQIVEKCETQKDETMKPPAAVSTFIEELKRRAMEMEAQTDNVRSGSPIVLSSDDDEPIIVEPPPVRREEVNQNNVIVNEIIDSSSEDEVSERRERQIPAPRPASPTVEPEERPLRREKLRCITGEVSSTTSLGCSSTPNAENVSVQNESVLENAREVGTLSAVHTSSPSGIGLSATEYSDISDDDLDICLSESRQAPRQCWSKFSKVVEEATSSTSEPLIRGVSKTPENVIFSVAPNRRRRSTSSSPCPTRTSSPTDNSRLISPSSTIRTRRIRHYRTKNLSRIPVRTFSTVSRISEDGQSPTCSRYIRRKPNLENISKGHDGGLKSAKKMTDSPLNEKPTCSRYVKKKKSEQKVKETKECLKDKLETSSEENQQATSVRSLENTYAFVSPSRFDSTEGNQIPQTSEADKADLDKFLEDITTHIGTSTENEEKTVKTLSVPNERLQMNSENMSPKEKEVLSAYPAPNLEPDKEISTGKDTNADAERIIDALPSTENSFMLKDPVFEHSYFTKTQQSRNSAKEESTDGNFSSSESEARATEESAPKSDLSDKDTTESMSAISDADREQIIEDKIFSENNEDYSCLQEERRDSLEYSPLSSVGNFLLEDDELIEEDELENDEDIESPAYEPIIPVTPEKPITEDKKIFEERQSKFCDKDLNVVLEVMVNGETLETLKPVNNIEENIQNKRSEHISVSATLLAGDSVKPSDNKNDESVALNKGNLIVTIGDNANQSSKLAKDKSPNSEKKVVVQTKIKPVNGSSEPDATESDLKELSDCPSMSERSVSLEISMDFDQPAVKEIEVEAKNVPDSVTITHSDAIEFKNSESPSTNSENAANISKIISENEDANDERQFSANVTATEKAVDEKLDSSANAPLKAEQSLTDSKLNLESSSQDQCSDDTPDKSEGEKSDHITAPVNESSSDLVNEKPIEQIPEIQITKISEEPRRSDSEESIEPKGTLRDCRLPDNQFSSSLTESASLLEMCSTDIKPATEKNSGECVIENISNVESVPISVNSNEKIQDKESSSASPTPSESVDVIVFSNNQTDVLTSQSKDFKIAQPIEETKGEDTYPTESEKIAQFSEAAQSNLDLSKNVKSADPQSNEELVVSDLAIRTETAMTHSSEDQAVSDFSMGSLVDACQTVPVDKPLNDETDSKKHSKLPSPSPLNSVIPVITLSESGCEMEKQDQELFSVEKSENELLLTALNENSTSVQSLQVEESSDLSSKQSNVTDIAETLTNRSPAQCDLRMPFRKRTSSRNSTEQSDQRTIEASESTSDEEIKAKETAENRNSSVNSEAKNSPVQNANSSSVQMFATEIEFAQNDSLGDKTSITNTSCELFEQQSVLSFTNISLPTEQSTPLSSTLIEAENVFDPFEKLTTEDNQEEKLDEDQTENKAHQKADHQESNFKSCSDFTDDVEGKSEVEIIVTAGGETSKTFADQTKDEDTKYFENDTKTTEAQTDDEDQNPTKATTKEVVQDENVQIFVSQAVMTRKTTDAIEQDHLGSSDKTKSNSENAISEGESVYDQNDETLDQTEINTQDDVLKPGLHVSELRDESNLEIKKKHISTAESNLETESVTASSVSIKNANQRRTEPNAQLSVETGLDSKNAKDRFVLDIIQARSKDSRDNTEMKNAAETLCNPIALLTKEPPKQSPSNETVSQPLTEVLTNGFADNSVRDQRKCNGTRAAKEILSIEDYAMVKNCIEGSCDARGPGTHPQRNDACPKEQTAKSSPYSQADVRIRTYDNMRYEEKQFARDEFVIQRMPNTKVGRSVFHADSFVANPNKNMNSKKRDSVCSIKTTSAKQNQNVKKVSSSFAPIARLSNKLNQPKRPAVEELPYVPMSPSVDLIAKSLETFALFADRSVNGVSVNDSAFPFSHRSSELAIRPNTVSGKNVEKHNFNTLTWPKAIQGPGRDRQSQLCASKPSELVPRTSNSKYFTSDRRYPSPPFQDAPEGDSCGSNFTKTTAKHQTNLTEPYSCIDYSKKKVRSEIVPLRDELSSIREVVDANSHIPKKRDSAASSYNSWSNEAEIQFLLKLRQTRNLYTGDDSNQSIQVQVAAEDLGDPMSSFDCETGNYSPAYGFETPYRETSTECNAIARTPCRLAENSIEDVEDQEVSNITSQQVSSDTYNAYSDDCGTPVMDEKDAEEIETSPCQGKIISLSVLKRIPELPQFPQNPIEMPLYPNQRDAPQPSSNCLPVICSSLNSINTRRMSKDAVHEPKPINTTMQVNSNSAFVEPSPKPKPSIEIDSEYQKTPLKMRLKRRISQCADINEEFNLGPSEPVKPIDILATQALERKHNESVVEQLDSTKHNTSTTPELEEDQNLLYQETWYKKLGKTKTIDKAPHKTNQTPDNSDALAMLQLSGNYERSSTSAALEDSPVCGKNEGRRRKPIRVRKLTDLLEKVNSNESDAAANICSTYPTMPSMMTACPLFSYRGCGQMQQAVETVIPSQAMQALQTTYNPEDIKAATILSDMLKTSYKIDENLKYRTLKAPRTRKGCKAKFNKQTQLQFRRMTRSTSQLMEQPQSVSTSQSVLNTTTTPTPKSPTVQECNVSKPATKTSYPKSIWQQDETKEILRSIHQAATPLSQPHLYSLSNCSSDSDDVGKLVIDTDEGSSDTNKKTIPLSDIKRNGDIVHKTTFNEIISFIPQTTASRVIEEESPSKCNAFRSEALNIFSVLKQVPEIDVFPQLQNVNEELYANAIEDDVAALYPIVQLTEVTPKSKSKRTPRKSPARSNGQKPHNESQKTKKSRKSPTSKTLAKSKVKLEREKSSVADGKTCQLYTACGVPTTGESPPETPEKGLTFGVKTIIPDDPSLLQSEEKSRGNPTPPPELATNSQEYWLKTFLLMRKSTKGVGEADKVASDDGVTKEAQSGKKFVQNEKSSSPQTQAASEDKVRRRKKALTTASKSTLNSSTDTGLSKRENEMSSKEKLSSVQTKSNRKKIDRTAKSINDSHDSQKSEGSHQNSELISDVPRKGAEAKVSESVETPEVDCTEAHSTAGSALENCLNKETKDEVTTPSLNKSKLLLSPRPDLEVSPNTVVVVLKTPEKILEKALDSNIVQEGAACEPAGRETCGKMGAESIEISEVSAESGNLNPDVERDKNEVQTARESEQRPPKHCNPSKIESAVTENNIVVSVEEPSLNEFVVETQLPLVVPEKIETRRNSHKKLRTKEIDNEKRNQADEVTPVTDGRQASEIKTLESKEEGGESTSAATHTSPVPDDKADPISNSDKIIDSNESNESQEEAQRQSETKNATDKKAAFEEKTANEDTLVESTEPHPSATAIKEIENLIKTPKEDSASAAVEEDRTPFRHKCFMQIRRLSIDENNLKMTLSMSKDIVEKHSKHSKKHSKKAHRRFSTGVFDVSRCKEETKTNISAVINDINDSCTDDKPVEKHVLLSVSESSSAPSEDSPPLSEGTTIPEQELSPNESNETSTLSDEAESKVPKTLPPPSNESETSQPIVEEKCKASETLPLSNEANTHLQNDGHQESEVNIPETLPLCNKAETKVKNVAESNSNIPETLPLHNKPQTEVDAESKVNAPETLLMHDEAETELNKDAESKVNVSETLPLNDETESKINIPTTLPLYDKAQAEVFSDAKSNANIPDTLSLYGEAQTEVNIPETQTEVNPEPKVNIHKTLALRDEAQAEVNNDAESNAYIPETLALQDKTRTKLDAEPKDNIPETLPLYDKAETEANNDTEYNANVPETLPLYDKTQTEVDNETEPKINIPETLPLYEKAESESTYKEYYDLDTSKKDERAKSKTQREQEKNKQTINEDNLQKLALKTCENEDCKSADSANLDPIVDNTALSSNSEKIIEKSPREECKGTVENAIDKPPVIKNRANASTVLKDKSKLHKDDKSKLSRKRPAPKSLKAKQKSKRERLENVSSTDSKEEQIFENAVETQVLDDAAFTVSKEKLSPVSQARPKSKRRQNLNNTTERKTLVVLVKRMKFSQKKQLDQFTESKAQPTPTQLVKNIQRRSSECNHSRSDTPVPLRNRSKSTDTQRSPSTEQQSRNLKPYIFGISQLEACHKTLQKMNSTEPTTSFEAKLHDESERLAEQLNSFIKKILEDSDDSSTNMLLTSRPQIFDRVPKDIFAGNGDVSDNIDAKYYSPILPPKPYDIMLKSTPSEEGRLNVKAVDEEESVKPNSDTNEQEAQGEDAENPTNSDENSAPDLELDASEIPQIPDVGIICEEDSIPDLCAETECLSEVLDDKIEKEVLDGNIDTSTPFIRDYMISGNYRSNNYLDLPLLSGFEGINLLDVQNQFPSDNGDGDGLLVPKVENLADVEIDFGSELFLYSGCIQSQDSSGSSDEKRDTECETPTRAIDMHLGTNHSVARIAAETQSNDNENPNAPNAIDTQQLTLVTPIGIISTKPPTPVEVSTDVGFESYNELLAESNPFCLQSVVKDEGNSENCVNETDSLKEADPIQQFDMVCKVDDILESSIKETSQSESKHNTESSEVPQCLVPKNVTSALTDKKVNKDSIADIKESPAKIKRDKLKILPVEPVKPETVIYTPVKLKSRPVPFWKIKKLETKCTSESSSVENKTSPTPSVEDIPKKVPTPRIVSQAVVELNFDATKTVSSIDSLYKQIDVDSSKSRQDVTRSYSSPRPFGEALTKTMPITDESIGCKELPLISQLPDLDDIVEIELETTPSSSTIQSNELFEGIIENNIEVTTEVAQTEETQPAITTKLPDLSEIVEIRHQFDTDHTYNSIQSKETQPKELLQLPDLNVIENSKQNVDANNSNTSNQDFNLHKTPQHKPESNPLSEKKHTLVTLDTSEPPSKRVRHDTASKLSIDDLFDRLKRESPVNPLMHKVKYSLKKSSSFDTDDNSSRDSGAGLLAAPESPHPVATNVTSSATLVPEASIPVIAPSMPIITTPSRSEKCSEISDNNSIKSDSLPASKTLRPTKASPTVDKPPNKSDLKPEKPIACKDLKRPLRTDDAEKTESIPAPKKAAVRVPEITPGLKKVENIQATSDCGSKNPTEVTLKTDKTLERLKKSSPPTPVPPFKPDTKPIPRVTFAPEIIEIPKIDLFLSATKANIEAPNLTQKPVKSILVSPSKHSGSDNFSFRKSKQKIHTTSSLEHSSPVFDGYTSSHSQKINPLKCKSSPRRSSKVEKNPTPKPTQCSKSNSNQKPPDIPENHKYDNKKVPSTPTNHSRPLSSSSSAETEMLIASLTAEIESLSSTLMRLPEPKTYAQHSYRKRTREMYEQKVQQLHDLKKRRHKESERHSQSKSYSERQPFDNTANHKATVHNSQRESKEKYRETRRPYVNKFGELGTKNFQVADPFENRLSHSCREAKRLPSWDLKQISAEEIIADLKMKKARRN